MAKLFLEWSSFFDLLVCYDTVLVDLRVGSEVLRRLQPDFKRLITSLTSLPEEFHYEQSDVVVTVEWSDECRCN